MTSLCPCGFPLMESRAAAKRSGLPLHLRHTRCNSKDLEECYCGGGCPCHSPLLKEDFPEVAR